ncbi:hypothetical protein SAMN05444166_5824 [Singulisphaera sp. GP187]|nr:hypothetical protein SAMN05444166_5824 [Singulisphaera sp. GP187]
MSDEQAWDDKSRDELREQLRSAILGELRLAKLGHEEILQNCTEVYIEDAPQSEREGFIQFSADEIERTATQLASERATWSDETDCDRLDRVENALRERGILLWQVSPCCDTCTRAELSDRIGVINERDPGFRDRARGYSFFIDQNLPESLADNSHLDVYLAYGWVSPGNSEVAPDVYQKNAIVIGREVCQYLRDEGFEVDWNGDLSRKIGITLNWQRRTMLQ